MGASKYRLSKSKKNGFASFPRTLVEAIFWDKKKKPLEEVLDGKIDQPLDPAYVGKVPQVAQDGTVDWVVPLAGATADSAMSGSSTNAPQNKVVKQYVDTVDGKVTALGQKVSELGIVTDDTYEDCLYVSDAFGNTILKVDVKGIKALGVETKEIKTIDDNYPAFSVTDNNGNIIFQLDARCGFLDLVERTRNNKLSVPAVSWIDDDFLVDDAGGNLTPNYAALHTWCITNNIRMDFALIDDASKVNRVHQFEKENFRFLLHPKHQGWYNDPVEGNTHNIATVKESLAENISFFKANNINSDCKIIVWPGDSDTFPDNMEVVGNYCECGIKATLEDCNFGNKNNRFALRRLSIIPSSDRPKSLIKDEIRSCLEQGGWVILYTHFYECDITITTPDETSNSVVNVLEIAGYANDLCKIRNTEAIWAERKIMYNL